MQHIVLYHHFNFYCTIRKNTVIHSKFEIFGLSISTYLLIPSWEVWKLLRSEKDVYWSCYDQVRLILTLFQIRLDAPSIYMPKLKSALPLPPTTPHSHDPHHQNIYQLCACANGKLFLAPPHGACAAREESLICRWYNIERNISIEASLNLFELRLH